MNILFVCHRLPFPPNRGGKIRPFNMIRHLGREHHVVVASLAHTAHEREEGSPLAEYCAEVVAEVLPSRPRWLRAAGSLATRTPATVAYFRSPALHRRIRDVARRVRFDLVWVHSAAMVPFALGVDSRVKILDFGDIDSAKWSAFARYRPAPLSFVYREEARKLRVFEASVAGAFDHCTVTAPGEAEELATLGIGVPCTVIPNGVDATYFERPARPRLRRAPVLVFLGRMDYFPNVDGIVRFARDVFPAIRRAVPGAMLRIIGSNPGGAVRRLGGLPGVSVTGYVPDVRPLLEDATLSIAPLRIARGTQNKILESMAMGLPVVASREAARGIQATAGRHLLVADDAPAFAAAVITLLRDEALQRTLSEAGRRQVTTAHTWSASMDVLDGLLRTVVEHPQGNSRRTVAVDQAPVPRATAG